jgi:hypothetical protein
MLSATPPSDIPEQEIFPGPNRERALDHPVLRQRLSASKPAELNGLKPGQKSGDPLVAEAVRRARGYVWQEGNQRVAVIVNRVRTAQDILRALFRPSASR